MSLNASFLGMAAESYRKIIGSMEPSPASGLCLWSFAILPRSWTTEFSFLTGNYIRI